MNYIRTFLAAPFLTLLSCDTPDSTHLSDRLSKMAGKNVLVTTSHPVAVSSTTILDAPSVTTTYDTATYLRGELDSVDLLGLVLNLGGSKIWIERDSVVSVVAFDSSKNPQPTEQSEQTTPGNPSD